MAAGCVPSVPFREHHHHHHYYHHYYHDYCDILNHSSPLLPFFSTILLLPQFRSFLGVISGFLSLANHWSAGSSSLSHTHIHTTHTHTFDFFFSFFCFFIVTLYTSGTMEWQPQQEQLRQLAYCLRDSLNPSNRTAQKEAEQVSFRCRRDPPPPHRALCQSGVLEH